MLLGLSRPTEGTVEVLGLRPRQAIARGLVSAVMQTGGLLKDLTVRETVAYTASLFADTRPVDEVLAHAGITGLADRKVGKCSGGEQQRLRFAMALLPDPALLLLDEPTTGHGRRGPAGVLVGDPRRRRHGSHRAVRHALPRGGRPVRRPHRADAPRPDRRRRHRLARSRRCAAGRTVRGTLPRPPTDRACRALAGVESVEVRGDTVLLHATGHRRGRALPAHPDRRPRPGDHRRAASRTRSCR